ncbi:MAG: hypothetical protein WBX15_19980 [Thermoanaerobaculia bacterium]
MAGPHRRTTRHGMRGAALFPAVLVLLMATAALAQQPEIRAQEEITVERLVIDARIIDSHGNPIEGLTRKDVRVRVDGRPAEVEAVEWVSEDKPLDTGAGAEPEKEEIHGVPIPRGRLLVFFFQTDFQRQRVKGEMRILSYAKNLLGTLGPEDRVAVVSFDSHLKLRQDFTSDHRKIETAIDEALRIDEPPPPPLVPSPALFTRIDRDAARKAAQPETALLLIGNALIPIPGPKSLLLFGWGLGHLMGRNGVVMDKDYFPAKLALEQARTAVFALDISDADYHSLEVGLGKVAADTGGFYAKTHIFPQIAMERMERVLAGHYEVVIKVPPGPRGLHKVELEVPHRRDAEVLARSMFDDALRQK